MVVIDRIVQFGLRVARPFLKWREPTILHTNEQLAAVLIDKNVQNPLIVTDKNLKSLGLLNSLLLELKQNKINYTLFTDVVVNPTIINVMSTYEKYVSEKCDAIIGFGGGSPLDVSKGVAAKVARPNKHLTKMGGILKVGKKTPLLFAIPTTAGTGSEATIASVVIDEEKKRKYAINDPVLIPSYALLSPQLTINLPHRLTATTGMDALTHAIEAYLNKGGNKYANEMAVRATELIFNNIVKVYDNPKNIEARSNMQLGAYYAGVAFTRNYVGYVHALSHPLSAYYGLEHGYVNAVILPFMLDEYGAVITKRLAKLAREAKVCQQDLSDNETARLFIKKIKLLNSMFGIGTTIPQIKEEHLAELAHFANKEARPLYPTPKIYSTKYVMSLYQRISGEK